MSLKSAYGVSAQIRVVTANDTKSHVEQNRGERRGESPLSLELGLIAVLLARLTAEQQRTVGQMTLSLASRSDHRPPSMTHDSNFPDKGVAS